jgi:hypothetical protein
MSEVINKIIIENFISSSPQGEKVNTTQKEVVFAINRIIGIVINYWISFGNPSLKAEDDLLFMSQKFVH